MSTQTFTSNYHDHSNQNGYQFEFFCDHCGNGHRSNFRTSKMGLAATMARAAGNVFGGEAWGVGWGATTMQDPFRGPAWDAAFKSAIEECKPYFRQCTMCGKWVCPAVCWNADRNLCKQCAPDLGEHAASIQAQVAVEQTWQAARQADQMHGLDVQSGELGVGPGCPNCQATLAPGSRFCAHCGTPITVPEPGPHFCSQCGGQLQAGAQFCAQCGKQAS
jgi:Double zinc ribbon/Prokaryotic RING finger family 2